MHGPTCICWANLTLFSLQKYRFYYQEYEPEKHIVSVPRQGWGIAAAGPPRHPARGDTVILTENDSKISV